MSDVPLGAFLSGGIDSSSIVAFMSQGASQPVRTFSMGFEDGSYNELPYAREVAELFGTRHTRAAVSRRTSASCSTGSIPHFDEPFADVSLFPTYQVSRAGARARDGGALGRRRRRAVRRLRRLRGAGAGREIPGRRRAAGAGAGGGGRGAAAERRRRRAWSTSSSASSAAWRRRRPTSGTTAGWCTWARAQSARLYTPALQAALVGERRLRAGARGAGPRPPRRRAQPAAVCRPHALPRRRHPGEGRPHGMATSLETRAPFLDVDVMELAFSMPGHLKIRNGERKYVLKQAMRGVLPDRILHRKKEGFSIPLKNWLRRELQPLMRDLLSPARVARRGLFAPVGGDGADRGARGGSREPRAHALPAHGLRALGRRAPAVRRARRRGSWLLLTADRARRRARFHASGVRASSQGRGHHRTRRPSSAARPGWPLVPASVRRASASASVTAASCRTACRISAWVTGASRPRAAGPGRGPRARSPPPRADARRRPAPGAPAAGRGARQVVAAGAGDERATRGEDGARQARDGRVSRRARPELPRRPHPPRRPPCGAPWCSAR